MQIIGKAFTFYYYCSMKLIFSLVQAINLSKEVEGNASAVTEVILIAVGLFK
jgi:hypothetical protein